MSNLRDSCSENGKIMTEMILNFVSLHLQQIVQEVKKMIEADPDVSKDTTMNAIIVDHYLWDYRRDHANETADIPIHKTRSIYY